MGAARTRLPPPRGGVTDRGYNAVAIREEIAKAYIDVVIPVRKERRASSAPDREKYKLRNIVERLSNKLKKLAAHRDQIRQTPSSYRGLVALTSIKRWIPDLSAKPLINRAKKATIPLHDWII